MPLFTTPTGESTRIPGVYSNFEVVSSLPGALPDFQIPVVMAAAEWGFPFDIDDHHEAHENYGQFQWVGTPSACKAFYGQDSDMGVVFAEAALHSLPGAYCCCMSALTRASVVATSVGPINEAKIYSRRYGWVGGWIKLQVAGGLQVDVTVPTRFTRLTANAALAATRVYVRDNSWIQIGASYEIGDNTNANVVRTVADKGTEYGATGQKLYWVEFTAAIGANHTTADFAAIAQYPATVTESSATFTTATEVFDWIRNSSKWIDVVQDAAWTGAAWIALAADTCIKEIAVWAAPTDGTSPAPVLADYTDWITDMDATEWDEFVASQGVFPRLFYVADHLSTVHAAMRAWAVSKRVEGYPVAIMSGCAWGDHVIGAGNDTAPEFRAAALNNQDFALAAGGKDFLGAFLSTGPAYFGLRAGSPVGHNLTNDDIQYEQLERLWDERNSGELTTLARAGLLVYRLSAGRRPRYRVMEGLSTLATNDNSWNTVDATTCLTAQRDLADYVDRVFKLELDGMQLGADEVDEASIAAVLHRKATQLRKAGMITDYKLVQNELDASGAGYNVTPAVKLPTTTDFIGLTTRIVVG